MIICLAPLVIGHLLPLLTASGAVPPTTEKPLSAPTRFKSKKYGYSIMIPRGWYLSVDADQFFVSSFPTKLDVGYGVFPESGAEILVGALPAPRDESARYILRNQISHMWIHTTRAVIEHLPASRAPAVSDLTLVSLDTQPVGGQRARRIVAYLFELHGRALEASIEYWEGDSKGQSYEDALRQIVESIKTEAPEGESAGP